MGSSLSHAHWTAIAIVCGLLYLIFDAARSFVQQVGPVTLRRWSGDPEMEAARTRIKTSSSPGASVAASSHFRTSGDP